MKLKLKSDDKPVESISETGYYYSDQMEIAIFKSVSSTPRPSKYQSVIFFIDNSTQMVVSKKLEETLLQCMLPDLHKLGKDTVNEIPLPVEDHLPPELYWDCNDYLDRLNEVFSMVYFKSESDRDRFMRKLKNYSSSLKPLDNIFLHEDPDMMDPLTEDNLRFNIDLSNHKNSVIFDMRNCDEILVNKSGKAFRVEGDHLADAHIDRVEVAVVNYIDRKYIREELKSLKPNDGLIDFLISYYE